MMCANITISEELIDLTLKALSDKRDNLLNFVIITKNADNSAISDEYVKCIEAQHIFQQAKYAIVRQRLMMENVTKAVNGEDKRLR